LDIKNKQSMNFTRLCCSWCSSWSWWLPLRDLGNNDWTGSFLFWCFDPSPNLYQHERDCLHSTYKGKVKKHWGNQL